MVRGPRHCDAHADVLNVCPPPAPVTPQIMLRCATVRGLPSSLSPAQVRHRSVRPLHRPIGGLAPRLLPAGARVRASGAPAHVLGAKRWRRRPPSRARPPLPPGRAARRTAARAARDGGGCGRRGRRHPRARRPCLARGAAGPSGRESARRVLVPSAHGCAAARGRLLAVCVVSAGWGADGSWAKRPHPHAHKRDTPSPKGRDAAAEHRAARIPGARFWDIDGVRAPVVLCLRCFLMNIFIGFAPEEGRGTTGRGGARRAQRFAPAAGDAAQPPPRCGTRPTPAPPQPAPPPPAPTPPGLRRVLGPPPHAADRRRLRRGRGRAGRHL